MFGLKKEDKEKVQNEYKKLLESVGKDSNNTNGFVLGEQKNIYNKGMSLDDIISKNNK